MIIKLVFAFFFLFSCASYAQPCHIKAFRKILKINKVLDSTIIKESDCGDKERQIFTRFLSETTGNMNGTHLSRVLKSESGIEVLIDHDIEVVSMKDFLEKELDMEKAVITNLSSLYGQASINLKGEELLSASCGLCSKPGNRNIKLSINQKALWLAAEIKIKRTALKLLKDVGPFTPGLDGSAVEIAIALDDGKAPPFRDPERLRFYKPNKPLSKGRTLLTSDLSPKTLVKYNQNVQVILKGKNVSLKTKATSRQNGRYGETIKLKSIKTNKELIGTVVDFNTVMVEL